MTRNGLLCFIETSDKQLNGVTPFQLKKKSNVAKLFLVFRAGNK